MKKQRDYNWQESILGNLPSYSERWHPVAVDTVKVSSLFRWNQHLKMPGMQSALPEVPTPTIWLQQTQITIPGDLITAKTLGEQRSRSSVSRDSSCRADQADWGGS